MTTSPSDPPPDDDPLEEVWKDVRVPGQACLHPRAQWYADREYGTSFCGVCHKDITNQMDQLLRDQGLA